MKTKFGTIWVALLLALSLKAQTFSEILGRPTDVSVTLNVLFDTQVNAYVEFGIAPGAYPDSTGVMSSNTGEPIEFLIAGLQAETRYYYRLRYRRPNETIYKQGPERSFFTQRKKGSPFVFTIESDPHPYDKKCYQPLWDICLQNQLNDHPDFMFDLGDTFGDDHQATTITTTQVRQLMLNLRPVFGKICHSVPFFFCQGNHEGESGYYLLQTPPNNLATYETLWRKMYYPNPYPDGFYSGNNESEGFGMGKPENYYAFEWGDALFVVVDGYRYYTVSAKPRNWEWTIGKTQYDWLKKTLENSTAKYKIVFTHHILGETRGATVVAKTFEWGGLDNGVNKFAQYRPDWEMPVHQLLVKNRVNLFVQGHDHLYAVEEMDRLIYQTMPMPSDSSYQIGMTDNGSAFTGLKLKGSGHLRITVHPDSLKVDFVSALLPKDETPNSKNGDVLHSYSVKSNYISGINNVSLNSEEQICRVFPNPVAEEIRIQFKRDLNSRTILKISGMDGRIVHENTFPSPPLSGSVVTVPANDNSGHLLPPGFYLLSVQSGQYFQVIKILIQPK